MCTRKTLLSGILVAAACLSLAALPPQKKIAATGFLGRTGNTTVIVDTDLAQQLKDQAYLPLLVWLGHTERGVLKATRESFSLAAPDGSKLVLAGFSEVVKGYGAHRISGDYSRVKMNAIGYQYADMYFLSSRPIRGVAFFPSPSAGEVMYDTVELPTFTWFRTLLYFPLPSGNPHGDYILRFTDAKGGTTVEVPFTLK